MSAAVAEAGRRLAIDHPDVDGVVALRINTISSALEQLRLRKAATSDTESCSEFDKSYGYSFYFQEINSWRFILGEFGLNKMLRYHCFRFDLNVLRV